jgi:DinB superfamily
MAPIAPPKIVTDKEYLLECLRLGRERYVQAVADVPEEFCRIRPAEAAWSVLECAEHVAVAEELMLAALAKRRPTDTPPDLARDARIDAVALDRTRETIAPEPAWPKAKFATLAEPVTQFESARGLTLAFLEQCGEDLRKCTAVHPMGVFDGCQLLRIMAPHPERHALQIEEIKKARRIAPR